MARLMSDAEIRNRKKVQGHVSQATGALGLAALGGTLAASRGGRTALRKIPKLKNRVAAPKPKDPNRDRIGAATTPVLATSAGLGGLGSFNFASYTGAESRKKGPMAPRPKQPVMKSEGLEMGYYGEEGNPVEIPKIPVTVEKAWSPSASNFDSEAKRNKRSKVYEGAALVGAGAGGAGTAHYGGSVARGLRSLKPEQMAPIGAKGKPLGSKAGPAIKVGENLKALKKPAGKLGAAVALTGGSVAAHHAIKRKRKGSWQPYAKRDEVGKAGDWKSIEQREVTQRRQRKTMRGAATVGALGAGLAGAAYAKNPASIKAAGKSLKGLDRVNRNVMGLKAGGRAKSLGRGVMREARGSSERTAFAAGAGTVGGAAAVGGGAKAGHTYQQHKINQRRRGLHEKKITKSAFGVDHLVGSEESIW